MNNDLISREAIAREILPLIDPETRVYVKEKLYNAPTVEPEKVKEGELVKAYTKGFDAGVETARPQGEFTDLEQEVIADSINYLLGAELLEENGYTETVINALKSVLQKIGAEENHL